MPVDQLEEAVQIRQYVWLGSCVSAQDRPWLRAQRISTIINATQELPCCFPDSFQYVHVPILDQPTVQLTPYLQAVHHALQAAKAAHSIALIHCMQGISRSAALLIAHLMQEEMQPLQCVFHDVRAKRHCVEPNPGFLRQLRQLELQLFGTVSSTKPLTFLDPGWQNPASHNAAAQATAAVEQLLAQAAADTCLPEQQLNGALTSLTSLAAPDQRSTLVQGIRTMLHNYGKLDVYCVAAHRGMFALLTQIASSEGLNSQQLLQDVFSELRSPDVWEDLIVDVPHAPAIMQNWPDKLLPSASM